MGNDTKRHYEMVEIMSIMSKAKVQNRYARTPIRRFESTTRFAHLHLDIVSPLISVLLISVSRQFLRAFIPCLGVWIACLDFRLLA